ncbi:hypothetical protein M8J76_016935 [Diaphorina citri]|nr:hypothetical protein M8J76_016935 [Diaphorina citri]
MATETADLTWRSEDQITRIINMQEYNTPCVLTKEPLQERVTAPSDNVGGFPVDLCAGMADLVAGYMDCMEEALRYLIEEEKYPEHHPAVQGLRQHLAQLLDQALMQQSMTVTPAA